MGLHAVAEIDHIMARLNQGARQETPERLVVLGKKNPRHTPPTPFHSRLSHSGLLVNPPAGL
jgi:hypothetical protein